MKPNSNKMQKWKFVSTSILDINIEPLWQYLINLSQFLLHKKLAKNLKSIRGNNNNKLKPGNRKSFMWVDPSKIDSKVIKISDEKMIKKISFKMVIEKNLICYKSWFLYKVSGEADRTLIKMVFESKSEINENDEKIISFINFQKSILFKNSKVLLKTIQNFLSFESCLINVNINNAWKFFINFKKVSELSPIIGEKFENKGSPEIIGSFWKYYSSNIKKIIFLRVNEVIKDIKNKTWSYSIETISSDKEIAEQKIILKFTKINEKLTHVSILHEFKESLSIKYFQVFTINKKSVIKKIKAFLEEV